PRCGISPVRSAPRQSPRWRFAAPAADRAARQGGRSLSRRKELRDDVERLSASLAEAHKAREVGLAACRRVIRSSGSSIRAVPRLDTAEAEALASAAETVLREAQTALAPFPALAYAGFLGDAEKEYAEARLTAALVTDDPLPTADDLGVAPTSGMKGLAEVASDMQRHLLTLSYA